MIKKLRVDAVKKRGYLLLFSLISSLFLVHKIQAQSKLFFTFDPAGNRLGILYCEGQCIIQPLAPKIPTDSEEEIEEITEEIVEEEIVEEETIADTIDRHIIMLPNPTTGLLLLQWEKSLQERIQYIELINTLGIILQKIEVQQKEATQLDLSAYSQGSYMLRFSFIDDSSMSRQVIKK